MISEDFALIERIGIGAFAFVLVYILLRTMITRNFILSDRVMQLAEDTIKENTKALQYMHEALIQHIRQKEDIVKQMDICRKERDEQYRDMKRR